MSGIQKILHAECEGFFVCSQPFCRQSVSISLFVSTFLQAECMGKLCCNLRLLISLVLVRNLVRDVVTLNLPGFEKVHLTTSIFSARLLNAFASEVISLSL